MRSGQKKSGVHQIWSRGFEQSEWWWERSCWFWQVVYWDQWAEIQCCFFHANRWCSRLIQSLQSFDSAHTERGAGSVYRSTSISPSAWPVICPQHSAVDGLLSCARRAGLIAAWPALSSKREQCHVDSWRRKLNTDLFLIGELSSKLTYQAVYLADHENQDLFNIVAFMSRSLLLFI